MANAAPGVVATLEYFDLLGQVVDERWSALDRRSDRLAEVAVRTLVEIPVPEDVTPRSVLGALAVGSRLPKQRASSDPFGQPPAVMYRNEDLEIQAITWMEGTT